MFNNKEIMRKLPCIVLKRCSGAGQVATSIVNQARTVDHVVSELEMTVVQKIDLEGVTGSIPGNRTDIDELLARKKEHNDFKVVVIQDVTGPREPLTVLGQIKDLSTIPQIDRSEPMKINEDGVLLRVFAGESDMVDKTPLYKAIVNKAKELGLAGATVLRGSMGFGANSVLHTSKVLELSTDLPIVIELVDTEANIRKLLPHIDAMVAEGMITMESVRILAYRHNPQDAAPKPGKNT